MITKTYLSSRVSSKHLSRPIRPSRRPSSVWCESQRVASKSRRTHSRAATSFGSWLFVCVNSERTVFLQIIKCIFIRFSWVTVFIVYTYVVEFIAIFGVFVVSSVLVLSNDRCFVRQSLASGETRGERERERERGLRRRPRVVVVVFVVCVCVRSGLDWIGLDTG